MATAILERVVGADETSDILDVSARPIVLATLATAGRHPQRHSRRLLRAIYRMLPLRGQRLALRLGAPKVTMGACAVIEDDTGRILVAHHTYRRLPWGLPGGLIDRGEQPEEALARELREELGAPAVVGPMICAESEPSTRHVTLYYRAALRGTPHEDGEEIDLLRYASPEEVRRLLGPNAGEWLDRARTLRAS